MYFDQVFKFMLVCYRGHLADTHYHASALYTMRLRIPLLVDISVIKHENKTYIPLDIFFTQIEKHRSAQEKPLRKDNFTARNEDVQLIDNT